MVMWSIREHIAAKYLGINIQVAPQCSYIAVDEWQCGLLERTLQPNIFGISIQVVPQCSYIADDEW